MLRSGLQRKDYGFTIVELLIVIVVIGILAAITIVAFNGVQERARTAAVTSALNQGGKKIEIYNAENGRYPDTLADANMSSSSDKIAFQYTNTTGGYCLTATNDTLIYNNSSTSGGIRQGACAGYNVSTWNKPSGPPPLQGATTDASVYRVNSPSMRMAPGNFFNAAAGPFVGEPGQTYTVSSWILTDANWNGLSNNSKIRFGVNPSGTYLHACGYSGVKTSWTQVSCTFTIGSSATSFDVRYGNDGSVGNIWIDDMSISKS